VFVKKNKRKIDSTKVIEGLQDNRNIQRKVDVGEREEEGTSALSSEIDRAATKTMVCVAILCLLTDGHSLMFAH
jgi:5S rRNA maturation endonuclease (ribonuclease M5)